MGGFSLLHVGSVRGNLALKHVHFLMKGSRRTVTLYDCTTCESRLLSHLGKLQLQLGDPHALRAINCTMGKTRAKLQRRTSFVFRFPVSD
jgi:hypothetical protein